MSEYKLSDLKIIFTKEGMSVCNGMSCCIINGKIWVHKDNPVLTEIAQSFCRGVEVDELIYLFNLIEKYIEKPV